MTYIPHRLGDLEMQAFQLEHSEGNTRHNAGTAIMEQEQMEAAGSQADGLLLFG